MLALERQKFIVNYLNTNKIASTKQLSELTGASLATLRRDLHVLSQQGLIMKTHGGAQSVPSDIPAQSSLTVSADSDSSITDKDSIAKKASQFITSNDIIFIGAGITCNLLCKYINASQKKDITVVTTNITAVVELASNPGISVLVLGGNIHVGTNHIETLDEYTVHTLEKLYFDKVFFTVDGVDLNYGYSIINRAQLPLYNHLITNSRQVYLLANNAKFNKRTFTHLCDLDVIPNVILNTSVEQNYLDYYREHNINVFTA
ncbi:DeoR/GlpR family DNA-binding transcription regulator [Blautia schinkii]|nr:DeoR/GlpR family DNA-binding transcription regulator [Blautia schinkii]